MRILALTTAAVLAFGAAVPAIADESGAAAGGAAGAATGAAAGLFIAGPVGAVVGGIAGAGVGAGVSSSAQDYARAHREASVTYEGDVRPGYRIGHGLRMYPIPEDQNYSYVYVNDRPVLIDNATGTVVWVGN
ncbi:MAG TPA: DUF1236 domain-containing protein [Devosiaceae bacterium]|jgi:hypothetical protein|nr:DUF1236 domain-containing protein [Devosiaceae bacterium]